ncbi:MAG: hypothetical protein ACW99U_12730 [Candidatus Thorarchaeota archaeon]|jgi:hypothetical protein
MKIRELGKTGNLAVKFHQSENTMAGPSHPWIEIIVLPVYEENTKRIQIRGKETLQQLRELITEALE